MIYKTPHHSISDNAEKVTLNTLLAAQNFLYLNSTLVTNIIVYIQPFLLFFLCAHYRLSESFYNTSIVDIYGYETPTKKVNTTLKSTSNKQYLATSHTKSITTVLIYIFWLHKSKKNLYNFVNSKPNTRYSFSKINETLIHSSEFFFKNAVWLERELTEMIGTFLAFKTDNRCLLLVYGKNNFPLRKLFPSQGDRDLNYNRNTDTVIGTPLGCQY